MKLNTSVAPFILRGVYLARDARRASKLCKGVSYDPASSWPASCPVRCSS
jgi:hypothetical protein